MGRMDKQTAASCLRRRQRDFGRCAGMVVVVAALFAPVAAVAAETLSPVDRASARATLRAVDVGRPEAVVRSLERIEDPLLRKTMQWFHYTMASPEASFDEISAFMRENPYWPRQILLRQRAEEAMQPDIASATVVAWFDQYPPVSTPGRVRLGAALLQLGRKDEAVRVLRDAWVNGNFGKVEERQFYKAYRRYLTIGDHEDRLDRLLWEGSYWPARRMFYKVKEDRRLLAEARFLLRHMRGNVDRAIAKVPAHLKNDPGLVYERLKWRRRKGRDESAREMLAIPLETRPHPELWFEERVILARNALQDGLISAAYGLVNEHSLSPEEHRAEFAEAEWLAGWIALRFLDEPETALAHFQAMYDAVQYPISRARGAYWAGRALRVTGDDVQAVEWFERAAVHSFTYYGQLAAAQLNPDQGLFVPPMPIVAKSHIPAFNGHELVRAVRLLGQVDQDRLRPFFEALYDAGGTPSWWMLTAALAREYRRPDLAIYVAKRASRVGHPMSLAGYPMLAPPVPPGSNGGVSPLETPLVLAVIRQESAFHFGAESGAGARGLMQLMPATAKRMAQRIGMRYSRAKLTGDPVYNMRIGQAYLAHLLEEFDGSYVLALAAYNAGPARVRAWVRENGHPKDPEVDAVDWVELIPFYETRTYVQRVMENLQVYRGLMAETEVALGLADDLQR